MAGEWTPTTLGDVADILTGFPFKSAEFTSDETDVRLLRGDNVAQGSLRWEGVKRWNVDGQSELDQYHLRVEDVILAMDRPWIEAGLKFAVVRESDLPCLLVQRVARLRAKDGIDQRFLAYVVGSDAFTDYILGVQTGTAVPHISVNQIRAFAFKLPPLPVQKAIGNLLGSLDDKIDLNRRVAVTLEEMSRALFKNWFVDFEPVRKKVEGRDPGLPDAIAALFPDRFGEDNLPVGWERRSLPSIATFLNGLALQKYPTKEGEIGLPVLKIPELRTGPTAKSGRATSALPEQYIVREGDQVFSWSGSLLQAVWTHEPAALNQHLFKVVPKDVPQWLCFFAVDLHLEEFQAIASDKAVTMGHIQRHHLDSALVSLPSREEINQMNVTFEPLWRKMISSKLEAQTHSTIRDTLLPKLMSGEVQIKDVGNGVEAA